MLVRAIFTAFVTLFYFSTSHASTVVETVCDWGDEIIIPTLIDTRSDIENFPNYGLDDAKITLGETLISLKDEYNEIVFDLRNGKVSDSDGNEGKCEFSNLQALKSLNMTPAVSTSDQSGLNEQIATLLGRLDTIETALASDQSRLDRIETALATGNLPEFTVQGGIPCNIDVVTKDMMRFGFASHITTEESILSLADGKIRVGIIMRVDGENLDFTKQFNVTMVKSGNRLEGHTSWDDMFVEREYIEKLGRFPSASCRLIGAAQKTE